jgi:nitrite reductase/ring-hydroxylating ferredoxin subunit
VVVNRCPPSSIYSCGLPAKFRHDMSTSVSRVRLQVSLAAALAVAGLLALAGAAALLFDLLGVAERSEWQVVGLIAELQSPEPQLHEIEQREFYLVWADGTPVALSTTDPHRGVCRIRWFERERFFADPCGGTVYLPDGSYRNGPSPRNMDRFAARLADGRVEVNLNRRILGRNHV